MGMEMMSRVWGAAAAAAALGLTGCATQFDSAATLSSYDRLGEGERRLVPVREFADGDALTAYAEVSVPLAELGPGVAEASGMAPDRIDRVRAALSKSLCRRLARDGYSVIAEPTDTAPDIRPVITGIRRNNVATTGMSRIIGVAVPGPLNPRVPIGIGALGVEAEMVGPEGEQLAAMVWASQNHLASGGGWTTVLDGQDGFSDAADAIELAGVFADAFGDLVTDARDAADPDAPRSETPLGACDVYYEMIGQPADAEAAEEAEEDPAAAG